VAVLLEVEDQVVVTAPGDGEFGGTAVVPDQVGTELRVTLRTTEPDGAREYRLVHWGGERWAGHELSCQVLRRGAAVQPFVAWKESGSDHDSDGMAEYRLQPFMLGQDDRSDGQGVFERGFCWSGHVTPGWIRMAAICAAGDSFCFRTYHAGFSDLGYAYCDRDSAVGTWDANDQPSAVTSAFREWRSSGEPAAFETGVTELDRRLTGQPCPCGGSFAVLNPLRCPTDGSVYVDMSDPRRRLDEYYFIQLHGRPIVELQLG
jgi:hypothetical protein